MTESMPPAGSEFFTLDNGCPIFQPQGSLRIGSALQGPHLLRDFNLLETISHITHERIPERAVHAKGAGAYGEFEVTNDISDVTSAAFLSEIGKKTKLFARFSTVVGERGSADSVRDTRGFAFKLYTEEGNLDWVFFSTPTFPIRDGGKFPSFVHSQKRDPQTGLRDPSTFWDFMSRNPETFHTLMSIFSDRGTPKSYRHAHAYSVNTYKFTKKEQFVYVRIHLHTNQTVKTLTQQEAEALTGEDPDAYTRDLFNSIAQGEYPSWTVYAQVINPGDVQNAPINIFDPTKTWPKSKYPLIPFGKITLNQNPQSEFGEVEQASFNPTALVPGWDVSPDPILQTRLFAYGSASRYRLGINHHQLPVNSPIYAYNPTKRDGVGYINNLNPPIQPNYFPADSQPPIVTASQYQAADTDNWSGGIVTFESTIKPDDWYQPAQLWALFKRSCQDENFVSNVAVNLKFANKDVRERTYACFSSIAEDLGTRVTDETEDLVEQNADDCNLVVFSKAAPSGKLDLGKKVGVSDPARRQFVLPVKNRGGVGG